MTITRNILKYFLLFILLLLSLYSIISISNTVLNAMNEVNNRTFEVNVAKAVDILGIKKYFDWRKDYEAYYVFVYSIIHKELINPFFNFINNVISIFLSILIFPFVIIGIVIIGWLNYNLRFFDHPFHMHRPYRPFWAWY